MDDSKAHTADAAVSPFSSPAARDSEIVVTAAGRRWRLMRSANLEELWEAMTEEPLNLEDERLPYWTELWPSSVALADWLELRQPDIAGRACLDMGCGLGLTALAGRWLGARVVAMDYEEAALRFAAQNACINHVDQHCWLLMDWRHPAVRARSMDRIWGGEIMYEKRFVNPVLRFLQHALVEGGVAWIAEPGRTVYDAFLHALYGGGWQGRPVHKAEVEPLYAQAVPVTVRIWEICRRNGRR